MLDTGRALKRRSRSIRARSERTWKSFRCCTAELFTCHLPGSAHKDPQRHAGRVTSSVTWVFWPRLRRQRRSSLRRHSKMPTRAPAAKAGQPGVQVWHQLLPGDFIAHLPVLHALAAWRNLASFQIAFTCAGLEADAPDRTSTVQGSSAGPCMQESQEPLRHFGKKHSASGSLLESERCDVFAILNFDHRASNDLSGQPSGRL